MSSKSKFKLKLPKAPPRLLDAIKASYHELVSNLGGAQYQVYVYTQEVERLQKAMLAVNQEAAARMELDKQETAKSQVETPAEGAQSEQA